MSYIFPLRQQVALCSLQTCIWSCSSIVSQLHNISTQPNDKWHLQTVSSFSYDNFLCCSTVFSCQPCICAVLWASLWKEINVHFFLAHYIACHCVCALCPLAKLEPFFLFFFSPCWITSYFRPVFWEESLCGKGLWEDAFLNASGIYTSPHGSKPGCCIK